jgi:hypothetical protein
MPRPPPIALSLLAAACAGPPTEVRPLGDTIEVTAGGEPFASVHWHATPRPFVWPLFAPGGIAVTRNHPMGERDSEQHDHAHHQSLWFAHGDVDGCDFWHGTARRERIEVDTVEAAVDPDGTSYVSGAYRWVVDDDQVLATEWRELRFADRGDHRTVDLLVTLRPTAAAPLRFGDTKEGTFALRVHPALRVEGPVASGTLVNSEGQTGKAVWGQRARWIDDSGVVDGHEVGITMFDHPTNLRHPTWWHARTYGLLAANPFGAHDFEGSEPGTGDFVLEGAEVLKLRYRVVLHGEGWDRARIEAAWADWVSARTDHAGR